MPPTQQTLHRIIDMAFDILSWCTYDDGRKPDWDYTPEARQQLTQTLLGLRSDRSMFKDVLQEMWLVSDFFVDDGYPRAAVSLKEITDQIVEAHCKELFAAFQEKKMRGNAEQKQNQYRNLLGQSQGVPLSSMPQENQGRTQKGNTSIFQLMLDSDPQGDS
ncbi:MAG: hypothetical protein AAGJ35_02035 [Myxococcota bacterium]